MIRSESRGHVGLLTIDRQDRRNALNGELCDELRTALAKLSTDLRAVVVTGAGSAFCAGADLVTRFAPASGKGAPTDTFRPAFERVLDAIVDHPVPVVAAINGAAIGAGMQLAVACDLRVAALGARLAIPGGRLGIHLSPRNVWRLAQLVGQGAARDFLLAGRTVTAEEALQLGLVQRLTDDALSTALDLAGEIASYAPLTVQGHKRSLNLVAESQWLSESAASEISELEARAFASDDLQEGMAAFAEKRSPDFHGR
ncbi:MAG TPA: enoyl-CoA hydratase-related protein [Acidimicrobiia bacterium]|nr:enoyl-CoA hydratase-related protein [Acidimicrobiia bacterium]